MSTGWWGACQARRVKQSGPGKATPPIPRSGENPAYVERILRTLREDGVEANREQIASVTRFEQIPARKRSVPKTQLRLQAQLRLRLFDNSGREKCDKTGQLADE